MRHPALVVRSILRQRSNGHRLFGVCPLPLGVNNISLAPAASRASLRRDGATGLRSLHMGCCVLVLRIGAIGSSDRHSQQATDETAADTSLRHLHPIRRHEHRAGGHGKSGRILEALVPSKTAQTESCVIFNHRLRTRCLQHVSSVQQCRDLPDFQNSAGATPTHHSIAHMLI